MIRNYVYGVKMHEPDKAYDILRAAHRFRNQMVEIELQRRREYHAAVALRYPSIAALVDRVDAIDMELADAAVSSHVGRGLRAAQECDRAGPRAGRRAKPAARGNCERSVYARGRIAMLGGTARKWVCKSRPHRDLRAVPSQRVGIPFVNATCVSSYDTGDITASQWVGIPFVNATTAPTLPLSPHRRSQWVGIPFVNATWWPASGTSWPGSDRNGRAFPLSMPPG